SERLKAVGIPVLALNHPVPGAPLLTIDNFAAGQIAGDAIAQFALRAWRGQAMAAVVVGPLTAQADRVPERVKGVTEALRQRLPSLRLATLDTQGNPSQIGP